LRSFHCASWDPLPLEEVRLRTFDFYQRLRGRQTVARPVIIVDIDEASLKDIGQWPWPRTIVADLVTQLAQLGAAAIAFDVIFAEPDRMSPSVAATSFRNLDEETRDKLRNLPSNDEVLAEAIRRSHTQNEPNFSQFIEWLAKLRLSAWTPGDFHFA
jgi:adenylate cyclase